MLTKNTITPAAAETDSRLAGDISEIAQRIGALALELQNGSAVTPGILVDLAQELSRAIKTSPQAVRELLNKAETELAQLFARVMLASKLRCLDELDELRGHLCHVEHLMEKMSADGKGPDYGKKRRKPGRHKQAARDFEIAAVVGMIVELLHFAPTRSHANRRLGSHSACSIVQAALASLGVSRSERTIEDIWTKRHNRVRKN
jgi:hypothetical protein